MSHWDDVVAEAAEKLGVPGADLMGALSGAKIDPSTIAYVSGEDVLKALQKNGKTKVATAETPTYIARAALEVLQRKPELAVDEHKLPVEQLSVDQLIDLMNLEDPNDRYLQNLLGRDIGGAMAGTHFRDVRWIVLQRSRALDTHNTKFVCAALRDGTPEAEDGTVDERVVFAYDELPTAVSLAYIDPLFPDENLSPAGYNAKYSIPVRGARGLGSDEQHQTLLFLRILGAFGDPDEILTKAKCQELLKEFSQANDMDALEALAGKYGKKGPFVRATLFPRGSQLGLPSIVSEQYDDEDDSTDDAGPKKKRRITRQQLLEVREIDPKAFKEIATLTGLQESTLRSYCSDLERFKNWRSQNSHAMRDVRKVVADVLGEATGEVAEG